MKNIMYNEWQCFSSFYLICFSFMKHLLKFFFTALWPTKALPPIPYNFFFCYFSSLIPTYKKIYNVNPMYYKNTCINVSLIWIFFVVYFSSKQEEMCFFFSFSFIIIFIICWEFHIWKCFMYIKALTTLL